ncbi:PREDICTED: putative GPI-anchored protein pfl2 [Amphimedon queenslandica]|uniref:Uncharacterized protein n=2 Tax=Amphimedon queenslandica TaxID=400682 RepID=A0AAN0JUW4_AMPQE|nr:PREDICTED: putative GPI-anchored protein pfl2 [Amphimedon queenslandica]|eukprot:XP_019860692.1 PREDICTED: putative GPI-anchored protein pfl2 [Amphimedon queenslandica]
MQGCYSNKEGVHKCIQDGGSNGSTSVSSTLQFRHSISSLNSNEMCSTQMTVTQTSCTATSTVTMQKESSLVSSSLISNIKYSTTSSMSSPDFLSSTLTLSSLSTSSAFSISVSTTVSPVQLLSTVPHYAGIGLLVATNLLTIIALISSCVYIFCQRKKSKFIVTENEQISLQNTSQTVATSHNTETNPTSNNNTNITSDTNIYSSVEDEVDHHHHHRPPARVASQYEVPLDLLQQAHVPLPPPPPLYATLDDQHDLTLPNPEYITNTAVTAPNPGYITNITPKANPGYSATAIKEGKGGERGEGERREELDYSYATVNKFLKKPTEDTEYNKLQHE